MVILVAAVIAFNAGQHPSNAAQATPASDPKACAVRMPSGSQSYYVMYPRTPIRGLPTAALSSGSTRIGYKNKGVMVQGEWVRSLASPDACWLKLSSGEGYISEINLSASPPEH